jgi:hypothetical protein
MIEGNRIMSWRDNVSEAVQADLDGLLEVKSKCVV